MTTNLKAALPAHPSGDKRFKMLDAAMKRHQYQPDSLLEALHTAQGLFGYLEDDLLIYVGHALKVPLSRVYGVATFYNFFSLKPQGKHTCVVCMGTACYVKGAGDILKKLEGEFSIKAGATTPDNQVSLLTARCIGACGLAPAVVYDGEVMGKLTVAEALAQTKKWSRSNDG
jgi:bidirectional [NiFe] hydrogenase diaphorase subunit